MRQFALQLLGDERDGGERRAELVCGGGGKPIKCGEALLARQHQFGGGECGRHLARFLGDAARIDGGEDDAAHQSRPHAEDIDGRQFERCRGEPRQRKVIIGEKTRADERQRA